eukprot:1992122-Pleurochrysis_carterae.AAC.5
MGHQGWKPVRTRALARRSLCEDKALEFVVRIAATQARQRHFGERPSDVVPPASAAWLACSQRRLDRDCKEGASPGETSKVVYCCEVAPRAHWTLRAGDGGRAGVGLKRAHVWHEPDGGVALVKVDGRCQRAAIRWMFQDVFRACGMCCPQQGSSAASDFVGLCELARVLRRYVRQAHDVVAVADGWWSSVNGVRAGEVESGHRECRAWRRRENSNVIPVGASLEQALVYPVDEHVVVAAASVCPREKRGDTIRPREGPGEEEEPAVRQRGSRARGGWSEVPGARGAPRQSRPVTEVAARTVESRRHPCDWQGLQKTVMEEAIQGKWRSLK